MPKAPKKVREKKTESTPFTKQSQQQLLKNISVLIEDPNHYRAFQKMQRLRNQDGFSEKKRALSRYNLFVREQKRKSKDKSMGDIGAEWKLLSEDEKNEYQRHYMVLKKAKKKQSSEDKKCRGARKAECEESQDCHWVVGEGCKSGGGPTIRGKKKRKSRKKKTSKTKAKRTRKRTAKKSASMLTLA